MTPKIQIVGLENRIFAQVKKSKHLIAVAEPDGVAIVSLPCRGPLAGARVPSDMIRRVASAEEYRSKPTNSCQALRLLAAIG